MTGSGRLDGSRFLSIFAVRFPVGVLSGFGKCGPGTSARCGSEYRNYDGGIEEETSDFAQTQGPQHRVEPDLPRFGRIGIVVDGKLFLALRAL